jgi:hypothetical protein
VELGGGGIGKENDSLSNVEIHNICSGRGYNDMH